MFSSFLSQDLLCFNKSDCCYTLFVWAMLIRFDLELIEFMDEWIVFNAFKIDLIVVRSICTSCHNYI